MKIYPSIITTAKGLWEKQLQEINNLKIKEACVFPNAIPPKERRELYKQLKKSCIKKVPLVHLRDDMKIDEVKYFVDNYHTKRFNVHSKTTLYPPKYDLSKYSHLIYIENSYPGFAKDEIGGWAGICLDAAHLENARLQKFESCKPVFEALKKYPCGCCHISGIIQKKFFDKQDNIYHYDSHRFEHLSDFDYIKRYKKYLPQVCVVELEESIERQLQIIEYIKKLLKS